MRRQNRFTISVCLACAVTLFGHAWLLSQRPQMESSPAASPSQSAVAHGPWDVDPPAEILATWQAESVPAKRRPTGVSSASYEAATADPETPADALHPHEPKRPLTRREIDEQLAVRDVIEEEMPETSAEERDIWFEELKSLPAEAVRDLLKVRKQLRVLSPEHHLSGPSELPPQTSPLPPERFVVLPAEPVAQSRPPRQHEWSAVRQGLEQAISWSLHNIANADTLGYKRIEVLLSDKYLNPDSDVGEPLIGSGSSLPSLRIDLRQGEITATDGRFDLAIEGDGFFIVHDESFGFAYSRRGTGSLNSHGQLCLMCGERQLVLEPAIVIPVDAVKITVDANGEVTYQSADSDERCTAGQLQLARVSDGWQLIPLGNSLYKLRPESRPIVTAVAGSPGLGTLRQGFLEQSNVDVDLEQTDTETWDAILRLLPAGEAPRTARGTAHVPK